MRKTVALICIVLVASLIFAPMTVYAETTDDNYKSTSTYYLLNDFVTSCPYRVAGTVQCDLAGAYIDSYLRSLGLTVTRQDFSYTDDYGVGVTTFNVVTEIVSTNAQRSAKKLIIGAHYDSIGDGASDNASGVCALLMLAEQLSTHTDILPCNVIIVAFGAEEVGLYGSQFYLRQMSEVDKTKVLAMINIDTIASGDNLYVYCEDKNTDFQDLVMSSSEGADSTLYAKPIGSDIYYSVSNYVYGYVQTAHNSDHLYFRDEGIPTVFFYSGIYDGAVIGYAESDNESNCVMNTSSDTMAHLDTLGGEYVRKIDTVIYTVLNTVYDDDFIAVFDNARRELLDLDVLYSEWRPAVVTLVCLAVLGVLTILYYRKLQKKAILGTAEIKASRVFTAPDADDIFKFKD